MSSLIHTLNTWLCDAQGALYSCSSNIVPCPPDQTRRILWMSFPDDIYLRFYISEEEPYEEFYAEFNSIYRHIFFFLVIGEKSEVDFNISRLRTLLMRRCIELPVEQNVDRAMESLVRSVTRQAHGQTLESIRYEDHGGYECYFELQPLKKAVYSTSTSLATLLKWRLEERERDRDRDKKTR